MQTKDNSKVVWNLFDVNIHDTVGRCENMTPVENISASETLLGATLR